MNKISMGLLIIVGLINIAPVLGVLSADRLTTAYDLDAMSSDLTILMRHRALLFGIIGAFVLYSVYAPQYQVAAMVMAGISMVGFLCLLFAVGDYNASLQKVAIIDGIGIICLVGAILLKFLNQPT